MYLMRNLDSQWLSFTTEMGVCGIAWNEQGVTHFLLPDAEASQIVKQLKRYTGNNLCAAKPPAWIKALVKDVKSHLKGKMQDFSQVPICLSDSSEFVRAIYRETQRIPAGKVLTYGELAAQLGKPGAMRAVGAALGKNPVPLLVPCHRIVAAAGKMGGFSSPGGIQTKLQLLDSEGVCLIPPSTIADAAQWRKAVAQLQKKDTLFAQMAKRVAPFSFQPHLRDEPVAALVSAIVSQQLSTKVAATIFERVRTLTEVYGEISAERILALPDQTLRQAGLSQMKVSFLKDLALHYVNGKLSRLEKLQSMSDEQIIREFTQIKGVGRWTVEMFLIFNLGRTDVFPVLDFGIRKGVAKLYELDELPDPQAMPGYGENWRPFRSVASLYLWRYQDLA